MNNSRQRQKRKKGNKYYQKHKKDFFFTWGFQAWSYKKKKHLRLKDTRNLFRKNLELKDVFQFQT